MALFTATRENLPARIRAAGEPLPPPSDEAAFARAFDRFADAELVLLGEASHGTAEFYEARAAITKRLIAEHGFSFVAIEGDWPDAAQVDAYVRGGESRDGGAFRRFPLWMWRNETVSAFVDWLHAYNRERAPEKRAGFHGLDIYSLDASIRAVIDYLDDVDPEAAGVARERYGCLTRWRNDPATYGRAALSAGYPLCEDAVAAMLRDLLDKRLAYMRTDGDAFLDAEQNARLIRSAERYYRIMYYGGAESWNLRDRHMADTLDNLMRAKGPGAKGVVWAHNSHVHDARAADMGRVRHEISLGQLCRERYGEAAVLIGFGTDRGTVAAASDWDGPMEVKRVRRAHPDSVERLFAECGEERLLLDLGAGLPDDLDAALALERLERFIGVIYRPETELASHYMDAALSRQFDAYVWFDETRAVTPLPGEPRPGMPETWPFGL